MNHSLQWKLLASFMIVLIVALSGVFIGSSFLISEHASRTKEKVLLQKGMEIARIVEKIYSDGNGVNQLHELLNSVDLFLETRVWVIDRSGQVAAMSALQRGAAGNGVRQGGQGPRGAGFGRGMSGAMGNHVPLFNEMQGVFEGKPWSKTIEHPYYGEKMLVVAVPFTTPNGEIGGAVLLNSPIADLSELTRHIYWYTGILGFFAVLITLFIVYRLTRSIVRPLLSMQEAAGAMARGDYTTRVLVESSDEVGKLGQSINSLAYDLSCSMTEVERNEKMRRDFVANVSHELRTPLTIIRGYHEAIVDGTITDPERIDKYNHLIRNEMERMERMVKDLLDLSRLQAEQGLMTAEQIPLVEVANTVMNMMKHTARQKDITLSIQANKQIPDIMGNGDRLVQLVLIMLDNALNHTPSGGRVTIDLEPSADNVILRIADTGSGIPAADLPYIWERFYKADKSHHRTDKGSGLGLAIAKQIIDLHKATVEVTSRVGKGTTFSMCFQSVKA